MPELSALSAVVIVVYGFLFGFGWAFGTAIGNAILTGLRR